MSELQRLKLILLVQKFGKTCYRAAQLLAIPYTNAKAIHKGYTDLQGAGKRKRGKEFSPTNLSSKFNDKYDVEGIIASLQTEFFLELSSPDDDSNVPSSKLKDSLFGDFKKSVRCVLILPKPDPR